MGKFCEMSDGVFLLEIKIDGVFYKRAFIPAAVTLSDVSEKPMTDGFYLFIPDYIPDDFPKNEK